MREHVLVEYLDSQGVQVARNVRVDGAVRGTTNRVFRVSAGLHTFDLGRPVDYSPKSHSAVVTGTASERPMTIRFRKISGGPGGPGAAVAE